MMGQTIKIFIDAHVFDGPFQGTTTFIKGIYTALAQKPGVELYLAAHDVENLRRHFPPSPQIFLIRYKSRSPFRRLGWEIPRLIRRYGIHYAHFQYIVPPLKNCRFIVTTHDVIFSDYPGEFTRTYRIVKKLLYRRSAQKADLLTTVSEYSRRSIEKHLGINAKQVHVIPNGVHGKFFDGYDPQEPLQMLKQKYGLRKFILYVSRMEPRKNHALLLRSFLDLGLYEQGFHLVLIGAKTLDVPGFDELMNGLPPQIESRILVLEQATEEELLLFYQAASLFVYPSRAEGFGIPPLEAAALKRPVVCSSTSAMSEFSFFGEDHVDPDNYELFRNRIAKALADNDQGRRESVSRLIKDRYCWQRSADKLYKLILEDREKLN
jgi:glycosyltransferase involved in cell wall biosynthesis